LLIDPTKVVAEILGEPSAEMRNPVNADYLCPFLNSTCVKTSQRISGPFPVCTIRHGAARSKTPGRLMCVCPKRFYGADLLPDLLKYCWPGTPPQNPKLAYEVSMEDIGTVDMAVADCDPLTGAVREFISVELQAVDISGSYEPAYQGVLNHQPLVNVKFGINWKNVQKRFISQLINKGIYHHHWGTRIVAVIQTPLYEYFQRDMQFEELPADRSGNTILFMLYDYVPDEQRPGAYRLAFDRVVGTTHNGLMTASLYRLAPSKDAFRLRIEAQLGRM
jgi:hypothetical protein